MKTKKVTIPKELSTDHQSIMEAIVKQSGKPALHTIAPGDKLTQEEAAGLVAELRKFKADLYPKISFDEPRITKATITEIPQEQIAKEWEKFCKKKEEAEKEEVKSRFTIPLPSTFQPAFDLIVKLGQVIEILESAIEKSAEGKKRKDR